MPLPFFAAVLVGFGSLVIGYILMPKTKAPKPPSVEDLENPTAEAGRPIPVPFGSIEISGVNVLAYGQKTISKRNKKQGKK
ncbi:hypothetical protein [Shimia sp.]|uniref:hypothetical protein n=1 Tax=Shimia sp. TaxID=1954381 RepID=UPI003299CD5F